VSQLVDAAKAGWWAYARPEGYVVRGKYAASDGTVYLADNDGKLEEEGWVVTGRYDNGDLERYYIDGSTHAAKKGLFTIGSDSYYGQPAAGYVACRTNVKIGTVEYGTDVVGRIIPVYATDTYYSAAGSAHSISTVVLDTPYLFLPSFADVSSFVLDFTRVDGGTAIFLSSAESGSYTEIASGAKMDLTAMGLGKDSNGAYLLYIRLADGSYVRPLAVMVSANIRAMYIISDDPVNYGRDYIEASPDHTAKATGTMLLVDPDGTVVYNKGLDQIKGRGNSTWGIGDKKPYQIKLSKKTDLLETGDSSEKNKTWCLMAEAFDPTLMHNTLALGLGRELGIPYTSDAAYIDLYYDGEYRGTYMLCEKVEVNTGRVDITDLESAIESKNAGTDLDSLDLRQEYDRNGNLLQYVDGIADPDDISGGYLLELDGAYYDDEKGWFTISGDYGSEAFSAKSPEYLSKAQAEYICGFMQEVYDCLANGGTNPQTGKTIDEYIDMDSFSKVYLLNEFSKNIDSFYSSTYFYKDAGDGKLYACSPWDFDMSMGIRNEQLRFSSYAGLFTATDRGAFASLLLGNSSVQMAVKDYYQNFFAPVIGNIVLGDENTEGSYVKSAAAYEKEIDKSQRMNYIIWKFQTNNDTFAYPAYSTNYNYFVTWLTNRLKWMNTEVASWDGSQLYNAATSYNENEYADVYDYQYYSSQYSDLIAAGVAADDQDSIQHFYDYGMSEGRQASLNFSPQAYRHYNWDLDAAFGNNWSLYYEHYITYGKYEGRRCTW